MLSKIRSWLPRPQRQSPSSDVTNRTITPAQLLEHRTTVMAFWRRRGAGHLNRGSEDDMPLDSLYRLYQFITIDDTIELRNEIEYFFNREDWPVKDIPDPQDSHEQRYAILAVLPRLLVRAFNRLIEKGLPRDAPPIIVDFDELAQRPRILEEPPSWAESVPSLSEPLKLPNAAGAYIEGPDDPTANNEFLDKNIWVEEPHIYFV